MSSVPSMVHTAVPRSQLGTNAEVSTAADVHAEAVALLHATQDNHRCGEVAVA